MKSELLSFRLTEDLKKRLEKISAEKDIPVAQIIRESIKA